MKKMKRKQTRKEMALKEREEHDAILNDPLELAKITMIEQEEAERSEREGKIFEERETAWIEAMEVNRKTQIEEEEEEERTRIKAREEEDELSRNQQVVLFINLYSVDCNFRISITEISSIVL